MMNERKILGKNIQRYRLFRGIGAEQLGEKVGLTKEHISRLETGDDRAKNIGLNYLLKIAQELNIQVEELFMTNPETVNVKLTLSKENLEGLQCLVNSFKEMMEAK